MLCRAMGQWFQSESGLHQNWMRDYDPTTGRYLEADPLGLVDGASVYGYVRQSPMMLTDPRGECPWCIAGALFAAGVLYDILSDEDGCIEPAELAYYVFSNAPPIRGWRALNWAAKAAKAASKATKGSSKKGDKPPPPPKPIDPKNPPNHPDFKPDKKHTGFEQIPWMGPGKKDYKDRNGNYWHPVPDGHGGTHAPHWEVQRPGGGYINVY
jgi:RHS repeat-associated protein